MVNDPAEFGERAGGDDGSDRSSRGGGEMSRTNGKPKAVGGSESHLAAIDIDQHTGEHRSGIVAGCSKGDLVDNLTQVCDVERQPIIQIGGR
jgi:hypothetical protein